FEADEHAERRAPGREDDGARSRGPLGLPQIDLSEKREQPLKRNPLAERDEVNLLVLPPERAVRQDQARGVVREDAPVVREARVRIAASTGTPASRTRSTKALSLTRSRRT